MFKRMVPLFVLIFALVAVSTAFGDTEDEIVAKYLQKKEKKVIKHVGYVSGSFSYGKLSDYNGYNKPLNFLATSDFTGISGTVRANEGIFRSKQIGLNLGMMFQRQFSFQIGVEYWLSMGDKASVDYTTTIGVLEENETLFDDSKISVYGATVGFNYHFLNPPDDQGILHSLSAKVGVGGGYYFSSWDFWGSAETGTDPLTSSAPAFYVQGGIEYPTPLFDMVLGLNASYFFLNFDSFNSYNEENGDLELSTAIGNQPLEIEFNGPRLQVEMKRYLKW